MDEFVDVHTQCNTNLFRAEFMCSIHEMSTNNWKHYAKSVLGRELHALLKLVLKYLVVEATMQNTYKITDINLFNYFVYLYFVY